MSLRLATAPREYSQGDQQQTRGALSGEDKRNFKRGEYVDVGSSRLILKDRTTGARYIVFVSSGVLDIELVP